MAEAHGPPGKGRQGGEGHWGPQRGTGEVSRGGRQADEKPPEMEPAAAELLLGSMVAEDPAHAGRFIPPIDR